MPPGPEGVKVVVGGLGEVVVVLPHGGDRRDQADVVPLLHPVARRRLVVRECVAVITCSNDVVTKVGRGVWIELIVQNICMYKIGLFLRTSSMRLILRVNEGVPFLCKNLITEPEEEDVAYCS